MAATMDPLHIGNRELIEQSIGFDALVRAVAWTARMNSAGSVRHRLRREATEKFPQHTVTRRMRQPYGVMTRRRTT